VECCYTFFLPTDVFAESYVEDKELIVPRGRKSWYGSAPSWQDFGTITESDNEILHVCEAVDLGLSVKWATCNVGAEKPEDYGEYYAWGETQPKISYSFDNYKWGSAFNLTKYNTNSSWGAVDYKTVLDSEDDVAHVLLWGGSWRMPTDAEWSELCTNCTWTWTDNYNGTGVKGRIVTAPNGNSIFLPAAGYQDDTDLNNVGSGGYYWSSSLWSSSLYNYHATGRATYVYFNSDSFSRDDINRYYGLSIRPVCP